MVFLVWTQWFWYGLGSHFQPGCVSTAPDFSQLVLDIRGGELDSYGLVSIMLYHDIMFEDNNVYMIIDAMCLYTSPSMDMFFGTSW